MRKHPSPRRAFLFLQGPHGSFFPRLGRALEGDGHHVRRINLNGGDRATWRGGDDYRGGERGWPGYIARYLDRHAVTDLVLFGDSRPPHVVAVAAARAAGVRVHVFEEGYIRPDWVTLERDGVNGHSTLPRDINWYLKRARGLPPLGEYPAIPSYATARGWAAFFYYAEVVLQHWRFPLHFSHRTRNPVWEGISYLRRFRRREAEAARAADDERRLAATRYFLFPLQLDSDYQIRVHSPFGDMRTAIETVLESFAAHAPADVAIAIKEHPLDSGLHDWRHVVAEIAGRLRIDHRVLFFEEGDLSSLVAGSEGTVTVNSTSGTLALAAGKPVKVLGDAVYDLDGITEQRPLAVFWSDPRGPDPEAWRAFSGVLASRCLIHGAFLSDAGIDLLIDSAIDRLCHDDALQMVAARSGRG